MDKANGWFERHVTESLERIETKVDELDAKFNQHRVDDAAEIATLKEKTSARASFFGLIGGAFAAVAGWFVNNA